MTDRDLAQARRTGMVRYKVYGAEYDASVAAVRAALGDSDFEAHRATSANDSGR